MQQAQAHLFRQVYQPERATRLPDWLMRIWCWF